MTDDDKTRQTFDEIVQPYHETKRDRFWRRVGTAIGAAMFAVVVAVFIAAVYIVGKLVLSAVMWAHAL